MKPNYESMVFLNIYLKFKKLSFDVPISKFHDIDLYKVGYLHVEEVTYMLMITSNRPNLLNRQNLLNRKFISHFKGRLHVWLLGVKSLSFLLTFEKR